MEMREMYFVQVEILMSPSGLQWFIFPNIIGCVKV